MGILILEQVLQMLKDAGIPSDLAYPGNKYPLLSYPVAAVHIEKVDQENRKVTVEVTIVSPGGLGGVRCEEEALKAASALRRGGAVCVQNGCRYNGASRVFTVDVLATFYVDPDAGESTLGADFAVYVNGVHRPFAVCFRSEQVRQNQVQYTMGEAAPVGIYRGSWVWKLYLEEKITGGYGQNGTEPDPVEVKLVRDDITEVYRQCFWDSVRREYSREGLHIIRSGLALEREVE